MSQVRTDILLNGMRLEIHPAKLTKCGEIHIDDDCTNAFLFCAFCSDADEHDLKFFRSLVEFVDHIRWHRSDELSNPESPGSPKDARKYPFEALDDDAGSNLSAPRHDADDIADWIAPPEELFELNTISNFIEIEPQAELAGATDGKGEEIVGKVAGSALNSVRQTDVRESQAAEVTAVAERELEMPEITGDVLIELLDLLKKCPCVWHVATASKTSADVIEGVYGLLTTHYNNCAQQTKSLEYVRGILTQIQDSFLEDFKHVEDSMNNALDGLPWYFPYLKFLLDNDSKELDKSIFTDFLCPLCGQDSTSQDDLWGHLSHNHLRVSSHNQLEDSRPEDVRLDSQLDSQLDDSQLDDIQLEDSQLEDDQLDDDIPMEEVPLNDTPPEDTTDDKESFYENNRVWMNYPKNILEKFIEVYRSQPRLWDKTNDEYFSRPLRRQSYNLLLRILRQHDSTASRSDVVSKINHLRTQFAYDRRKILSSENNCKVVPPSWIYEKMKFLVGNMGNKARRKPLPALKPRPANFKKKVINAKCPICALNFNDHSGWLSHMESAHTSKEYQSEDGFFYCKICGWQNKTKELLMRHIRNKHTHNLKRCTDCNLGFRLLSLLAEHRAKVHNDFFPFKCETCDEGFATRTRLRTHSMTHWSAEDLPHKCEHCGAKFSDRNTYNVHVRRHVAELKYSCEICSKAVASRADLRQHTRTHLNDCPHICDSCGKAFRSAQLLTDHLNEVHGGVTFPCDKCEKEFKSEKLLADHCQGHEVQHHCDVCGATFLRKTSLHKHQRLKHDLVPYDHIKYDYSL